MKKGTATTTARTLVEEAKVTRIVSGRNSVPSILKDLSKAYSLENGGVVKDAQAFLISGELGAFLVKDPDALTILTDLHDTHAYEKEWINTLKGTGVDKLKAPCITLLGATNEEHFADAVPSNAIGGGFIARTFIVFSQERGQLNSLTHAPKKVPDVTFMSVYLSELAKVSGEFKWGNNSKDTYDAWYYPFMKALDGHDPTGTNNRIGDQILKVAMLLSLAESPDLVLKESHIVEAITSSLDCVQGMKQVTMGAGRSNLAYQTKLVVRELLSASGNQILRSKLLSKFWGEFTDFDLDRIVATLAAADAIDIQINGSAQLYKMKKSAVNMYQKAVQSIQ
jgi:hypothetical protein